jgi:hypothetical protein
MICALCLVDNPLRNSHVIPEFLYETMYDDKHRFTEISTSPSEKNKYRQKGVYESMLCDKCEQTISVWEGYANQVFNGGIDLGVAQEGKILIVQGLDYKKLKLFQLSVLWRSSVAKSRLFRDVMLGPHEEIIRRRLLEGEPGPANIYGCIMCPVLHEGKIVTDVIVEPHSAHLVGHRAYNFIFGGMAWVFVINKLGIKHAISQYFLQENGNCRFRLTEINELSFLRRSVITMREYGKI